jgi:hypothetical protein
MHGGDKNAYKILLVMKGELGIDGRIILRLILMKE